MRTDVLGADGFFSADAVLNAQDLLTRHTAPVAQFLNGNYERFFDGYTELLQSENYVTRRQSLKVLHGCLANLWCNWLQLGIAQKSLYACTRVAKHKYYVGSLQ